MCSHLPVSRSLLLSLAVSRSLSLLTSDYLSSLFTYLLFPFAVSHSHLPLALWLSPTLSYALLPSFSSPTPLSLSSHGQKLIRQCQASVSVGAQRPGLGSHQRACLSVSLPKGMTRRLLPRPDNRAFSTICFCLNTTEGMRLI